MSEARVHSTVFARDEVAPSVSQSTTSHTSGIIIIDPPIDESGNYHPAESAQRR